MNTNETHAVSRRTVLGAAAGGLAAAAVSASTPVAAQEQGFGDWFSNVSNYDGVVDARGRSEVRVAVGAPANGGAFGFAPAAVRVDPGTTVVWEWTGEGSPHDVAATDGSYASEMKSDAGATFRHTFESASVSRYACTPHEPMGMKGAVVVGDAAGSSEGEAPATSTPPSADTTGGAARESEFEFVSGPEFDGWFRDVSNFRGVADARGHEEVRVAVGAPGNGEAFAFEPAAVWIDPGTTVVWEWTGDGGTHDVAAADGSYASETQTTAGATYALVYEGSGVSRYACTPHEAMGMKGAVVVGEVASGAVAGPAEWLVFGGVLGAVLSPLAFAAFLVLHGTGDGRGTGNHEPSALDPATGSDPADQTHPADVTPTDTARPDD